MGWEAGQPAVISLRRHDMKWVKPEFCDLRMGFEVTAYVFVR
jgi:coenzyme PQQ precursor peptide PqqA